MIYKTDEELEASEFGQQWLERDEFECLSSEYVGSKEEKKNRHKAKSFIAGVEILLRKIGGDEWQEQEFFMAARHDVIYFHAGEDRLSYWSVEEIKRLGALGFHWDPETLQWSRFT